MKKKISEATKSGYGSSILSKPWGPSDIKRVTNAIKTRKPAGRPMDMKKNAEKRIHQLLTAKKKWDGSPLDAEGRVHNIQHAKELAKEHGINMSQLINGNQHLRGKVEHPDLPEHVVVDALKKKTLAALSEVRKQVAATLLG